LKKIISTIATGVLIASVTATSVSAAPVKVHKGDTLWDIARDHDATVDQLMNVNDLHSSLIHPNQILYVSEQYTVKPGDTLSGIAYDFGTTVKDIKATNNLKSDLIIIGQVLSIKGDSSPQVALPTKSDQAETKAPVVDQEEEGSAEAVVSEEPTTKPKDKVVEPQEKPEEVAEPVEKTAAPVTEPKEEKTEEPVEEPKEEKTEEPVEEPKEEKTEETVEEPKEEKTEEPVEEPKEEKAEEPVEESKEEEAEETVTEPEEETSEEPEADEKEEVVKEQVNEDASQPESPKEDSKATAKAAPSNTNDKVAEQAAPVQEETKSEDKAEGNVIHATATAYTAKCVGCSGITATGVDLNANPNAKVIAVDPSVIPLGSQVYVEGYGYAVAADTGGAIKGNKVDVHLPTKAEALNWGNRAVNVTIIK